LNNILGENKMTVEEIKKQTNEKMEKCVNQLKKDLATVRTGRANPMILDKVLVEYYGAPTPLRQLSQVSVQDGTTLVIAPFDKSIIKEVEKALIKADLGINPNSDGVVIRLAFPPLTSDKRKEICKDVKKVCEDTKVAIRNIRRDMTDELKKLEKAENLSEDTVKDNQDKIQKLTDKYSKIADDNSSEKEKEVMTV
jgi:ribosome recycling factor